MMWHPVNNQDYPLEVIRYLYEDGARDYVFFAQILGVVSYDQNDNSYEKFPIRRLQDAVLLAKYLINEGGFKAGKNIREDGGKINILRYPADGGDLFSDIRRDFDNGGLTCDELTFGYWLTKSDIGAAPDSIPSEIQQLFSKV